MQDITHRLAHWTIKLDSGSSTRFRKTWSYVHEVRDMAFLGLTLERVLE